MPIKETRSTDVKPFRFALAVKAAVESIARVSISP
jgi:hypothetical protein